MSDDPMADFLAREKAALGDDADLFASGQTPSAPGGMDDFSSFSAAPSAPQASSPTAPSAPRGLDAFPELDEGNQRSSNVRVTGVSGTGEDEEREKFESAFPDLSGEVGYEAAPKPVFNALAPQPYGASPYPPVGSSPTSSKFGQQQRGASPAPHSLQAPKFSNTLPPSQEDTPPIKAWREKQAEDIKQRDERDKGKREEMKNKAEKAIDGFYDEYNKVKESNIRENKENEAAFKEKLSEGIAKGTAWERVSELISLENSQRYKRAVSGIPLTIAESKTIRPSVPGGSDLARMKEILLALRREGDRAPGAQGY